MLPHLVRTIGFTLVGVLSFSIWAFFSGKFSSEIGLYIGCAIVFLVLGGPSLLPYSGKNTHRINPHLLWLFPIGFLVYAVFWCIGWFMYRNHFGEIMGSAIGIIALCAIFKAGLRYKKGVLEAAAMAFLFYTVFYYLGEKTYQEIGGLAGKLGWGIGFGAGLGAGLSHLVGISTQPKN